MSQEIMTLRQARTYRALSQDDLATMARVSHFTIRLIEQQRCSPRPSTRRKLAAALDFKPWEILWKEAS